MEGLADYSQVSSPYESVEKDHRTLGWNIGRQLVALYLVEMLLRIDFERRGITSGTATHNLASLFRQLPKESQKNVEKVYTCILNNEVRSTWDVCQTAISLLDFLGKKPITKTRYPWQQQHNGTLYSPAILRPLIYALLIGLHSYPYTEDRMVKRYDTEFRSFEESRKILYDRKGNRITE